MNATTILRELTTLGATVAVVGDRLHVEAPRGAITPELRRRLVEHKRELLAALAAVRTSETGMFLSSDECAALVAEVFRAVCEDPDSGAACRLIWDDAGLFQRFKATEKAVDLCVSSGPRENELRNALLAHVSVIREACGRVRARRDATSS